MSLAGISSYYVLQYFRSWNDAVRTARLRPYALNIRPEDRALIEDWGNAARRHHRAPQRHAYIRDGKYSPATIEKSFGPWSRLPKAFRNFAKGKPQWANVLALLPPPAARGPVPKTDRHRQRPVDNSLSAVPQRETGSTKLTADTALRFARYFRNSPAFWMNRQTRYDLEVAEDEIARQVERDVQPLAEIRG